MEAQIKYKRELPLKHGKIAGSIFLVDDDVAYLFPLGFYLQRHTDYNIYCYKSGEECLKNLTKNPEIIVLDINLYQETEKSLNGIDVLKRIKSERPKTKVIMLSGRDSAGAVLESMKSGAYMYIVKDIEAITKLRDVIGKLTNEDS